jgi:hypothetical protein
MCLCKSLDGNAQELYLIEHQSFRGGVRRLEGSLTSSRGVPIPEIVPFIRRAEGVGNDAFSLEIVFEDSICP